MLFDTIMTMFSIEMIKELNKGDNERTGDYVNFKQWRINVNSIIAHIKDQGSSPRQQCYKELDVTDQKFIVKEIGMFTMELVDGFKDVKAEFAT